MEVWNIRRRASDGIKLNQVALQHARVNGDRNATSSVFWVIVRFPRHLDISQRTNHGVRSEPN